MMRSIDLFVASDQTLGDLAEGISKLSGFNLSPGTDGAEWWLQEGDIRARLSSHPYIDDGDLDFSRYPYVLSCRVRSDTRLADAAETVLLRLIAESLHKGGMPTLLVHDLQYRDRGAEGAGASRPGLADPAARESAVGPVAAPSRETSAGEPA